MDLLRLLIDGVRLELDVDGDEEGIDIGGNEVVNVDVDEQDVRLWSD